MREGQASPTLIGNVEELIRSGRLAEAEFESHKLRSSGVPESEIGDLLARVSAAIEALPDDLAVPAAYLRWFYDRFRWKRTWNGVPIQKSPLDLWNYQEIIVELCPQLIIEYRAHAGGSALCFAHLLDCFKLKGEVLSVDISLALIDDKARKKSNIRFIEGSSTSPEVQKEVARARERCKGRAFAILDSDHGKSHVYAELVSLRNILRREDYLVVEDGIINGHPVLPCWGEGPYEALQEYFVNFPEDYLRDRSRELLFGWTFAPAGFLIRR